MNIGIFGHYGNKNLGDEAIIEATIAGVTRHFDKPTITCYSVSPEDTAERHGVQAFSIISRPANTAAQRRDDPTGHSADKHPAATPSPSPLGLKAALKRNWLFKYPYRFLSGCLALCHEMREEIPFLITSYRRLKTVDLLIVTGSNQFMDSFGGVTGFPLSVVKWAILCKLSGTKIAFVSVGAGPIFSPISKFLIRITVYLADYLSFRDRASRELVEGDTKTPKGKVFPDLASNLSYSPADQARRTTGKPRVGINPMPVYDNRYWYAPDNRKYQAYFEKLAEFSSRLITEGYPVFFFGTQTKDYNVINDILPLLPSGAEPGDGVAPVRNSTSVKELMTAISDADIVVATRFHSTVLPLTIGVPVLGICYYRKADDLLREMGQEKYSIMLDDFDADLAYEKFKLLETNLDLERRKIEDLSEKYRDLVEQQYALLASTFAV